MVEVNNETFLSNLIAIVLEVEILFQCSKGPSQYISILSQIFIGDIFFGSRKSLAVTLNFVLLWHILVIVWKVIFIRYFTLHRKNILFGNLLTINCAEFEERILNFNKGRLKFYLLCNRMKMPGNDIELDEISWSVNLTKRFIRIKKEVNV